VKSFIKYFVSTIVLLFAIITCDTSDDLGDVIELTGQVSYISSNGKIVGIDSALVTAGHRQGFTNSDGIYSIVEPDSESISLTMSASKIGFNTVYESVQAVKGIPIRRDFLLKRVSSDSSGDPIDASEDAAHIEVVTPHESTIYVYSSGLKETAILTFKVTDAHGKPVDASHAVNVNFSIVNGPGGGEYLYPDMMTTTDGFAYTVLNSGTKAGPVQIEASFQGENGPVYTLPTRVAIRGGLPDEDHFSVALDKVNIAGQVHFGILDNVTAFVGDKFSNPVAPGVVVYFSTDYGIIEGAAVTDELGRATVQYMSAAPLPPFPDQSSFANITAWTYGDTISNTILSTGSELLLSSVTDAIDVSPSSFNYNDDNTAVPFSLNVSDIFDNPIVSGSTIRIKATDGELFGDTEITMLDTRFPGQGSTDFNFTWASGDSLKSPQVFISITVSTPALGNGYRSTSIAGVKVGN